MRTGTLFSRSINAEQEEIIFTLGDTESNNLTLNGIIEGNKDKQKKKILVSKIEHFSVLDTAKRLAKKGYAVDFINVNNEGFIDLNHLEDLIDESTLIVSVTHGNHEVGTLQNLKSISEIVHKYGSLFHSYATYSYLQVLIDINDIGVDLLTLFADKVHGSKGVGALYIRKGTP
ncbi:MAG: cysteine desulfurase NifS, partial [Spirochaetes bacterium]